MAFVAVDGDRESTPENENTYVAIAQSDNIYYPVICVYPDQITKSFLAAYLDVSIRTLLEPSLEYSITGGMPAKCSYMLLVEAA